MVSAKALIAARESEVAAALAESAAAAVLESELLQDVIIAVKARIENNFFILVLVFYRFKNPV